MSIEHSPEHNIAYQFVCYDARGRERAASTAWPATNCWRPWPMSAQPTSSSSATDGTGIQRTLGQYGRWVDTMAARTGDRDRLRTRVGGFRPVLVGLHWPSKAWADEELTSLSYAVRDDSATVKPAAGDTAQQLVAGYADRISDGPVTRDAIRTIVDSALRDAAPPTLPDDVREAYRSLDASLGGQPGGVGAVPGDDREVFDPEETYQAALLMDVVDPMPYSGFTLGGVLAPLRVLTFWEMKRRACSFGETGAANLLGQLQEAAPSGRFHVMGHSFGCIVASAAVAGAPSMPGPRRGVDTLVLAQGALSLWSFCADIPARPARWLLPPRCRRPPGPGTIMVTTSSHDRAVRVFYPLGAGAAARSRTASRTFRLRRCRHLRHPRARDRNQR